MQLLLLLAPKDAAHDLFSNGFFRNMAEELFTKEAVVDDGTDEVTKNTILNSMIQKSDFDIFSNVSLQDASLQGRGEETDPLNN